MLHNAAGRVLSFYIEMDTGSRPATDYLTKVKQYDWYFKSGAWRHTEPPFPAIAVFVWKMPRGDEYRSWDNRVRASDERLTTVMEQVQA